MEAATAGVIGAFTAVNLLTIIINLTFVYVIWKHKHLQTLNNRILVSLAVSDFLVGAIVAPISLISVLGIHIEEAILCVFLMCCLFCAPGVTVFHLLIVSLERYIAIAYPLHYPALVTEKRVQVCIAVCWFAPIFICSLPVMGWNKAEDRWDVNNTECGIIEAFPCSYLYFLFSCVVVIIVAVIGMYISIYQVAMKQARQVAAIQLNMHALPVKSNQPALRREVKTVLVLFATVVFFIVSISPVVITMYSQCHEWQNLSQVFLTSVFYLVIVNSTLNPLIYGFGNRAIRTTFIRNLCKNRLAVVKCCEKNDPVEVEVINLRQHKQINS